MKTVRWIKKVIIAEKAGNLPNSKEKTKSDDRSGRIQSAQFPLRNQASLNIVFPVTVDDPTKR